MENETANKALDVIVAITDERDSWQAQALAAEAALEVARREREVAKTRSDFFEKEAMNRGHQNATLVVQRDAALAQAAGLQEALKLLLGSCVYDSGELTVPSRYVVHGATAALDTPGPTIGEIKAEAAGKALHKFATYLDERVAPRNTGNVRLAQIHGDEYLAEAARLRGGGK